MPLSAGTRLGAYEIVAQIGVGGMGEVYRANDTRLKRAVALKTLPDTFAKDPDRLARFQREAELLAALNHPNIAAIYGLENSNGVRALVLELIEGPTLAARIATGGVPLDETLPIARQIAAALEGAHEQGIIHRDLKPANIKLRPDGVVKVLDFGLAKLTETPASSSAVGESQSPTITTPAMMTEAGMILGTAAYMSPEQAKGRPADRRSDVWAFGCVLFEMLTGTRAFNGEQLSDTLAEVLKGELAWNTLPPKTPPAIRRLLRRCLTKDPRQRLSDIGTARLDIEDVLQPSSEITDLSARAPSNRGRERVAWTITALLFTTLALTAVTYTRRTPAVIGPAPEMRVAITIPADSELSSFALSPDGTKFVYMQGGSLWLRSLASEIPQRLTEDGDFPFWSPDNQSIAFFGDRQLRRIDLTSGLVQTLAKAPIGLGGTWSADGTILYVPSHSSPAWRLSAVRGTAEPTRLGAGQVGHRFPQFLPDGRHFLYLAMGTPDVRGLYVGSLDSQETHRLFASDSQAVFAPPDSILFQRQGALLSQRIDLQTFMLVGNASPVAPQVVVVGAGYNAVAVTASATARVAYRPTGGLRQLVWIDRKGQRIASLGDPDDLRPYNARLSPDGHALALDLTTEGETDVWILDTERGTRRRLTHKGVRQGAVAWSPDGRRLAFASERSGVFAIHDISADGLGSDTLLTSSPEPRVPRDWSPDRRFLLFLEQSPEGGGNDWVMPLSGDHRPIPITQAPDRAAQSRFSPDGHWIAYQSSESGRPEIYVRRFPELGTVLQVSTKGGSAPLWQRDGRALIYLERNQVMSASLALSGNTPTASTPVGLFSLGSRRLLEIATDGQRFLALEDIEPPSPITLLLNWAGPRH